MTSITAAVAQIIAQPAPVIILDTCNLLDLFRRSDATTASSRGSLQKRSRWPPNSCYWRPPVVSSFLPRFLRG